MWLVFLEGLWDVMSGFVFLWRIEGLNFYSIGKEMGFGWLVVGGGGYLRLFCWIDNCICFVLLRYKK